MKNILWILALLPFLSFADDHCKHSEWGPDDEAGAANRVTAASVLEAAKLIRTGKTYSLGIVVDSTTPAFSPRSLSVTVVQPNQQGGAAPFGDMNYNDDIFMGWLGIGSQLDGLGHLGYKPIPSQPMKMSS